MGAIRLDVTDPNQVLDSGIKENGREYDVQSITHDYLCGLLWKYVALIKDRSDAAKT